MIHTPGSWSYQALAGQPDYAVYADATGQDIALVRNFDLANARLIAAAPELLAALRETDAYFTIIDDIAGPNADHGTEGRRIRAEIKTAIAKAEGR